MAEEMKTKIEVQAAAYEGYTVWINSLIQSAGGKILDGPRRRRRSSRSRRARRSTIISTLANSSAGRPVDRQLQGGLRPPGVREGRRRSSRSTTRSSTRARAAIEGFQDKIGWAPYPRVDADTPAKAPIGGFNFGVGALHRSTRTRRSTPSPACATSATSASPPIKGGLPPTLVDALRQRGLQEGLSLRGPDPRVDRERRRAARRRRCTPTCRWRSRPRSRRPTASTSTTAVDGDLKQVAQDALDGKGLN